MLKCHNIRINYDQVDHANVHDTCYCFFEKIFYWNLLFHLQNKQKIFFSLFLWKIVLSKTFFIALHLVWVAHNHQLKAEVVSCKLCAQTSIIMWSEKNLPEIKCIEQLKPSLSWAQDTIKQSQRKRPWLVQYSNSNFWSQDDERNHA